MDVLNTVAYMYICCTFENRRRLYQLAFLSTYRPFGEIKPVKRRPCGVYRPQCKAVFTRHPPSASFICVQKLEKKRSHYILYNCSDVDASAIRHPRPSNYANTNDIFDSNLSQINEYESTFI